jgi:hypothetical protein
MTQSSEAEVVYTPADQSIWANGGILDLNNDGIADFKFVAESGTSHTTCGLGRFGAVAVSPVALANAVRGPAAYDAVHVEVSALPSSFLIGSNPTKFKPGATIRMVEFLDFRYGFCRGTSRTPVYETFGSMANTTDRYLGLQFSINGETHYGWARFDVTVDAKTEQISITLTGYAYETIPGAPIFAGDESGNELRESPKSRTQPARSPVIPTGHPATLGRLAQGAQGLPAWRVPAVGEQE